MAVDQPNPKLINGNARKYYSYQEAWRRIKLAQAEGFFLEVVTIAESIITAFSSVTYYSQCRPILAWQGSHLTTGLT